MVIVIFMQKFEKLANATSIHATFFTTSGTHRTLLNWEFQARYVVMPLPSFSRIHRIEQYAETILTVKLIINCHAYTQREGVRGEQREEGRSGGKKENETYTFIAVYLHTYINTRDYRWLSRSAIYL